MKTVFLAILFMLLPAFVHAESDPFELPNPITGEPGVWIPPWVQKLYLETDAKLKLCTDTFDVDQALIAEKNAEIAERISATDDLRFAVKHTQVQLVAEQVKRREAEASSHNRLVWALITTGGVLLAGTVLTIDLLH